MIKKSMNYCISVLVLTFSCHATEVLERETPPPSPQHQMSGEDDFFEEDFYNILINSSKKTTYEEGYFKRLKEERGYPIEDGGHLIKPE